MNTKRQAAPRMASPRQLALAAGLCYLITHVTSVPAAFLYAPILNRADYVLGSGTLRVCSWGRSWK